MEAFRSRWCSEISEEASPVTIRANTPIRPHPFYAVHLGISNVRLYIQLGRSTRVFREYKFPTPVKLLHSLKIFNKGLMMMMMMMMTMMMMMCKRLAQVPMLCVPIYNSKLAMMQTTPIFTTFSAHTKMAADKRGQIEVFARNHTHRIHGAGIYANIGGILMVNVTIYSIHGSYGIENYRQPRKTSATG